MSMVFTIYLAFIICQLTQDMSNVVCLLDPREYMILQLEITKRKGGGIINPYNQFIKTKIFIWQGKNIQSINSTTSDHVCGYIILIFKHETGKSEITFLFLDICMFLKIQQMEYLSADTNKFFLGLYCF